MLVFHEPIVIFDILLSFAPDTQSNQKDNLLNQTVISS
jgi:hypothetical protein